MIHQRAAQTRTAEANAGKNAGTSIQQSPAALLPVHPFLHLQQTIGNQAVQRLLRSHALQAKLTISEPDDIYEQEADRVADEVMRMPVPAVQRACACESGGSPCPKCDAEEGKLVQRKTESSSDTPEASVSDNFLQGLGPGQPLDPTTRAFFEPRFGHDFSQVRVHTGGPAAESARSVNALAYTVGRDVVFSAGQYEPRTNKGRRLLGHELTHVVQQRSVLRMANAYPLTTDSNQSVLRNSDVSDDEGGTSRMDQVEPRVTSAPLLQRAVTTDKCGKLEPDVKAAHDKAMEMTNKALALLKSYDGTNPASVKSAMSLHFHTTDVGAAKIVINAIEVAKSGAEDAQYECHENETSGSHIAWSMWCVPFTDILLYKPWFESSRTLTKRAKTMTHEWMHRYSCEYDLGYEGSDEYNNSSWLRASINAAAYGALIEALGV